MNNIKQALESAIEAVESAIKVIESNYELNSARWKLKAALAELDKCEPVATIQAPDPYDERDGVWFNLSGLQRLKKLAAGTKLYTSPPQQQWVGLSEDDIHNLADHSFTFASGQFDEIFKFANAIEAKIKELNT